MNNDKNEKTTVNCKTYFADGSMNIEHVEYLFPGNAELIKQFIDGHHPVHRILEDDALRDCINEVMPRIVRNRYWFCIIKTLMLQGQVRLNDFDGAASRIRQLYPAGLAVDIDVSDLQSMHFGSFTGPIDTWKIGDGPLKRDAEFKVYVKLAKDFENIVKNRLLF